MRINIEASDRRDGADAPYSCRTGGTETMTETPCSGQTPKLAMFDRAATAHAWAAYEPHSRVPVRLSPGNPFPPQTVETLIDR